MNWIEKLFGKKEQNSPEIRFDELQGWFTAWSERKFDDLSRQSGSIFLEIEAAIRKIRKSTALLQEATLDGRYHLKMVKIASSNRDNMVKQVGMLVENINIPKTKDARTIIDFHENALQTLQVCLENMIKSYQYAKLVFPEDAKQVIADVNSLGRMLHDLNEPIGENRTAFETFEKAEESIKAIKSMNSDRGNEEKVIKEIEGNIALLKKQIEENEEIHKNLLKSQEWRQYLDRKDDIAGLGKKAENIESEINGMILPLNKALNRLNQLSESGRYTLSPHTRENLRLCLSDPKCVDPGFFVELGKIIESDTLALASDKKDKMIELVKIAETSFEASKKRYQALKLEIERKRSEVTGSGVASEDGRIRKSISVLRDKLAFEEKRLDTSKKHLATIENSIEITKHDLQKIVSTIDERMKVLF